jgi:simple sugar transport system permease protein
MTPFDANWLVATIALTTPILLAATGELIAERAGIFNIGLEGMTLSGAFAAFLVTWQTGSIWLGIFVGLVAGMLLAALMALLSIELHADQVIAGVGLNILALGVTTFAFEQVFATRPHVLLEPMRPLEIPVLSQLPYVGKALFNQVPIAYVAFLMVPIVWFVFYRTSWGLSLRAAGELPEAVETAGVSVRKVRWSAELAAGGLAGLGGSFLSVVSLGFFVQGMSAGRGYIALAAVIFGGWRPLGVLGACLVFGGADALQLRLQAVGFIPRQVWLVVLVVPVVYVALRRLRRRDHTSRAGFALSAGFAGAGVMLFALAPRFSLPSQLWLAAPYLLTLVVLAGFVRRPHMPSALAVPLRRKSE